VTFSMPPSINRRIFAFETTVAYPKTTAASKGDNGLMPMRLRTILAR
jgi:hypothetical protein